MPNVECRPLRAAFFGEVSSKSSQGVMMADSGPARPLGGELESDLRADFQTAGRVWLRGAVSEDDLALLDDAMSDRGKPGQRLGQSDALNIALSSDRSLAQAIRQIDPEAQPVRTVAFDKSDGANWGVPWHQDRVIAVAERAEVPGYGNWTKKSGVWHCEPPKAVLDKILFVRVHLDDTDEHNGAMKIAVGSHASGVIPAGDAEGEAKKFRIESCDARRGDVLILGMLTLHCSKPARVRSGRRALRIDFSSYSLPSPLKWFGKHDE